MLTLFLKSVKGRHRLARAIDLGHATGFGLFLYQKIRSCQWRRGRRDFHTVRTHARPSLWLQNTNPFLSSYIPKWLPSNSHTLHSRHLSNSTVYNCREPLKCLFQVFAVVCFLCAISLLYGVSRRWQASCGREAVPWRWLDAQDLMDLLLRIEYVADVPMWIARHFCMSLFFRFCITI